MKIFRPALLFASCLAACGSSPPPADPTDAAAAATPRLTATIADPSTPAGTAFRMNVAVENFELMNPQTMPGVYPGAGHYHYQLDTASTYTAAWAMNVNVATAASTPPGAHTLRVWLVDGSHQPISPRVETILNVTIE